MAKLLSEKEKKLQKKLIPVNIIVCIISLVAALTLFLTPILKIDFGKIMRSEAVMEMVEEQVEDAVGGSLEGSSQEDIDFVPVISAIVKDVLESAEGNVSVTALSTSKFAFDFSSSDEQKFNAVFEELFTPLIAKLTESVSDGISGMFKEDGKGSEIVEQAVVSALATKLADSIDNENVTKESVLAMTEKFRDIENITDGDVTPVMNEVIKEMEKSMGEGSSIPEEDKKVVIEQVQKMYDDAAAELGEGEKVTFEAIACVAVSKNVDLGGFNINDILGGISDGSDNGSQKDDDKEQDGKAPSSLIVAAEGEAEGGQDGGSDDKDADKDESDIDNDVENPDGGNQGSDGSGSENPDGDKKIVTSYEQLMQEIGFDDDTVAKLKTQLSDTLNKLLKDETAAYQEYFKYYGYVFYGIIAFILPWVVLFLFSFFHLLAKNKRFMMWYVKLYSFIPGLISLALIFAPKIVNEILPRFLPDIAEEGANAMINALLGGVSSMGWISGICYILLWLISICWAFPIKHKIRKERKLCKQGGGSREDYGDYSGGKGKGKKGGKGGGRRDSYDDYGGSYDDGGFDDDYDGYDGYGGGYGSYGGSYGGYGSYDYDDDDDDDY